MNEIPLLIEFAPGSTVRRQPTRVSRLPIVQNGPPGTSVHFQDGTEVNVPTDQIVFSDDSAGCARVGFGGMEYRGVEDGQLVFHRVRDLAPPETLSPERGRRMTLEPHMVAALRVAGARVWPAT